MDKQKILNYLQRYRYLLTFVSDNPEGVISDCVSSMPSRYLIFPCDIIELRQILQKDVISFLEPIILFPQRFAEKYLRKYPLFLIIDSQRIGVEVDKYGGLMICKAESISIGDNLIRIIVNEPAAKGSFAVVKKIVHDFGIGAECLVSNSIPGVTASKNKKKIKTSSQQIHLTNQEKSIFDVLLEVKKRYNLPVEFRVAGGWVRDKLMGVFSNDIDIAVNMPGYEVAKYVEAYGGKNVGKAYNVSLDKSAVPVDKSTQSSDLMVGSIPINGIKVELVPMRTESYPDPLSRRPVIVRTNNPQEDAKRRDLTINALFYNIETGQIEDYVGGVRDLGLDGSPIYLRTPDDPIKTFQEDPLRVLRVLRFFSKYPGSIIDDEVLRSINDDSVHKAYQKKVAMERAGPEIMKLLMGMNPVGALRTLFDSGLYKTVFNVPSMEGLHPDGIHMDQKSPFHKYNLLEHTLKVVENLNNIMLANNESPKMRGIMNLAALFHDFGKMKTGQPHPDQPDRMIYKKHEDESDIMAEEIMNSLGMEQKDKELARMVIQMHMKAIDMPDKWSRKRIGRFIRQSIPHGKEEEYKDIWKYILYHAEADSMSSDPDAYDSDSRKQIYNKFLEYTESPSGQQVMSVPLNGNEIMSLPMFQGLSPSTGYIKVVKEILQELQDDNPNVLTKEEAIDYLNRNAAMIQEAISRYMQGNSTMSKNWFKKIKLSQVIEDGCQCFNEDPEIKKGPIGVCHRWVKGQKVRDRRRGIANPSEYGIIDKVEGNSIKIVWNPDDKDRKRENVFDVVRDAHILAFLISEV